MAYVLESSAEPLPEDFVGRRTQRRGVIYPGSSARHELLVPNLRGELEAVYVRARPGMRSPVYKHDSEDFACVLKGRLAITVGDDIFTLSRGDSVAYPSHTPSL
jgi:quercetin dioxygenase-like cupin family protein